MSNTQTITVTKQASPDRFTQWRPRYHLLATKGWMNDPCGLSYDPIRKKYHAFFQWNPFGNDWGNMSWGHAVSDDLVSWNMSEDAALQPDASYDSKGIFTGAIVPTDLKGESNGAMTAVYTSVSNLPIHHTLPYTYGSETLSLATSTDGGFTWKRIGANPILPGPPSNVEAISWRDPYVSRWPSMSEKLGLPSDQLFGLVSGGIRDRTPTTWLYAVNPNDLRDWRFISDLVNIGKNFCPPGTDFDMGANFECTNFLSLNDKKGHGRDFLIMSCEGIEKTGKREHGTATRCERLQAWMSGPLETTDDKSSVKMKWECSGCFDYGIVYAVNSFWDPVIEEQVMMGWIVEDDLPDSLRRPQGWSGSLTLPRVAKHWVLENVVGSRQGDVSSMSSFAIEQSANRTKTVRTLGVSPHPNLENLRRHARRVDFNSGNLSITHGSNKTGSLMNLKSHQWELKFEAALPTGCSRIGFNLFHSPNSVHVSRIYFAAKEGQVIIERSALNSPPEVNVAPESAPHLLFTTRNGDTGIDKEEKLKMHMFYDQGILELYVNDRTVITSRVYPLSTHRPSLQLFVDGDDYALLAPLESQGTIWDGLEA